MKKIRKKTSASTKKPNNTYFLTTLCTENGNEFFGKMKSGKMEPTRTGLVAREIWETIPVNHEGISLDDYVIMPNHMHGIISCPCKGTEKQILKALEKSIIIIGEFRKSVKEQVHKTNSKSKFAWAKNFNVYNIKDENELYDMRYYIEKETAKWEFDSENMNNKLYIVKTKK